MRTGTGRAWHVLFAAAVLVVGCDDGGGGGGGTPSVSIADVSLVEGTGGTTEFIFTVALSAAGRSRVCPPCVHGNGGPDEE